MEQFTNQSWTHSTNHVSVNGLAKFFHQSCDGLSNMQCREKGVVARIQEECPKAKGHQLCHEFCLLPDIYP